MSVFPFISFFAEEPGYYSFTEEEVDAIIADACLQPSEYEKIKEWVMAMALEDEAQSHKSWC